MVSDPASLAWARFIQGLEKAGKLMESYIVGLDPLERADGYRAISRIIAANLEKLELDGLIPEVQRDNRPNHKWFLDNPDGIYWHIVVDPSQSYCIRGNLGQACYTSITAYTRGKKWFQTRVGASLRGSELECDEHGSFELIASAEKPASGIWLPLKDRTWLIWIRQFFEDVYNDQPGWFQIENLDPRLTPIIDPDGFARRLDMLGEMVEQIVTFTLLAAKTAEKITPNQVQRWEEMQAGAVYTLSDIDYMRGSWKLGPDEALVLEGRATSCSHWNIVLYSRFLNSLERRRRPVSLTGSRIKYDADGNYRIVIAHQDPGVPNWLDTEGRAFGLFVIRWLFPEGDTVLPQARIIKLKDITSEGLNEH